MAQSTSKGEHDTRTWTTIPTKKGKSMTNVKTTFATSQLKSIVERVESLEEEKKAVAGDIKEVFAEAKANGFDTKILRKVLALRKMERAEREEQEAMIDLYMSGLGMIPNDLYLSSHGMVPNAPHMPEVTEEPEDEGLSGPEGVPEERQA